MLRQESRFDITQSYSDKILTKVLKSNRTGNRLKSVLTTTNISLVEQRCDPQEEEIMNSIDLLKQI